MRHKSLPGFSRHTSPPRHRRAILSASLLLNLLGLAIPIVTLQLFDRIIPQSGYGTLSVLALGLLCVFVAEFVLRAARNALANDAGARFERELTGAVMKKLLRAKPKAFGQITTGQHLDRIAAVPQIREHIAGQGQLITADVVFALIFAGFLWMIGGPLVLVPLASLALIALGSLAIRHWHARALSDRESVDSRRYSFLIEYLAQIRTVRAHMMEQQMLRRYELLAAQSQGASQNLVKVAELRRTISAGIGQFSIALMALFGATLVINAQIGVGAFAACMLLNGRMMQPLMRLLGTWAHGESTASAASKLDAVSRLPQALPAPGDAPNMHGRIVFQEVTVRSDGREGVLLFADVSAELENGDLVHVETKDPKAATAVFELLGGDRSAASGTVRVDERSAGMWADQRGCGGLMLLDRTPAIFQGTIMENITLFGAVENRTHTLAIAEALGLDAVVRGLPLGYETELDANTANLSIGRLQLVALTRALSLAPKILLLDHAASALDEDAAARLARTLRSTCTNMTVLVATEQPALREVCNKHLDLAKEGSRQADVAAWDADRMSDQPKDIRGVA